MKPLRNELESWLMLIIFSFISRCRDSGLCGLVRGGGCCEREVKWCLLGKCSSLLLGPMSYPVLGLANQHQSVNLKPHPRVS